MSGLVISAMRETTDPKLVARYAEMAAGGANLRGMSTLVHARAIEKLIRRTGAVSLLDYGSGAGDQYVVGALHSQWGVPMPTLYDPAFPSISQKPIMKFDGVICNDVLEHVDEGHVVSLIAELFEYADKFVFASVCTRPAKKAWQDGTNLHVTVKPFAWWERRFKKAARNGMVYELLQSP